MLLVLGFRAGSYPGWIVPGEGAKCPRPRDTSDSLEVEDGVADATDGSPLSNVGVYIDDVLAGTPTLGIASPSVAAMYGNPAYGHAKYQFLYPATSLAAGAHWVTVIAVDSGGRSTTFGPNIFTVE